ncbi:MAG TPA: alpha-D-ribose 1-methylphosphonate 5-triphosphate diphosphatase [Alphaproteobacteria bacterium]|nr:alpha-D-ribose 1-methylphosphonate 5-triphosphate diphosphatase [Alphaproteobacteria bacterium]
MRELAFTNARIILADEVIHGSLAVKGETIDSVDDGDVRHGEDLEGDYLLPGLVELHTDHFENHYRPRQGVTWNALAALQAHDAQVAGAGITTVFDAIRIGSDPEIGDITADVAAQVGAIEQADGADLLRAEHLVHLRCELPSHDCYEHFDAHCDKPVVKLASVMDHTPGARQYTTLEHYVAYYQKKMRLSDDEMAQYIRDRQAEHDRYADSNRARILARGKAIGLAFASHDDATPAHVEEALREGVSIAEFPTTMAAARAAHEGGLAVLMGAPNLVRGRSHNGNVAATDLAREGVLDVLSSDYVPFALMLAGFLLPEKVAGITLPGAIATITRNPARAAHLDDRGEIAPGKRADLLRVRVQNGMPVVRAVYRQGRRVS